MDVEFVIPLNKEDLLNNRASEGYGVRKIYEPAKLSEKLEGEFSGAFEIELPVTCCLTNLIYKLYNYIIEFLPDKIIIIECCKTYFLDCNVQYRNEGPTSILTHFDVFYSVLQ